VDEGVLAWLAAPGAPGAGLRFRLAGARLGGTFSLRPAGEDRYQLFAEQ